MQRLVAYRFERDDLETDAARAGLADETEHVIRNWLRGKRAPDADAEEGTFRSQSLGARATFRWQRAVAAPRSWRMVHLDEEQPGGRRFSSAISVTDTGKRVVVYASLSTGSAASTVAPIEVGDAKCPRVVRDILKHSAKWRHGETLIEPISSMRGASSGAGLARRILNAGRSLPIIVITEEDDELLIAKLDETIAHELAGLALVVRADEPAAWELTKELGPTWSCYYGAVRLFWPQFRRDHPPMRHPRWRPDDILSPSEDDGIAAERLCAALRRQVFRAAALGVARPTEIEEIRAASARVRIEELLSRGAPSASDAEELATLYEQDAVRLREDNERLQGELATQAERIAALEIDLANADAIASARAGSASGDAADIPAPTSRGSTQPTTVDGHTRPEGTVFYKKTGSSKRRDRMVRVADCGHNRWESSASADKARKGIIALEQHDDWRGMYHCAACTGGGMWKVRW